MLAEVLEAGRELSFSQKLGFVHLLDIMYPILKFIWDKYDNNQQ
jgi:hypothetical protein